MAFAILIPLSYLIGSIPFGLLVGLLRGVDVRKTGSGNIGATNVGRLLGKQYFFLVFFLDMFKSLVPMAIASFIVLRHGTGDGVMRADWRIYLLWLAVGFAAVIGHMFSVFMKFKGGKGVSTSAGVMLGLFPYYTLPGVVAISLFVIILMVGNYMSLASILGACSFPLIYLVIGSLRGWPVFHSQLPLLIFAVIIPTLITYKHRQNISRLLAGTESKFRKKSDVTSPPTKLVEQQAP